MDFKLTTVATPANPVVGDLHFGDTGDFVEIEGVEEIGQLMRSALEFLIGEWFLDLRQGVAWLEEVLRKGGTLTRRKALIRRVLLTVPGVTSVERLTADFDRTNRVINVGFQVRTEQGRILRSEDFDVPFIVGEVTTSTRDAA